MSFTIVTGLPRSGTSATMGALRHCGIPIVGAKYPVTTMPNNSRKQLQIEGGWLVWYDSEKDELVPARPSNPNGFWELASINKGGLQKDHEIFDGWVIKVTIDKIERSNKDMIDKAIVVLRDFEVVLYSHLKWMEDIWKHNMDQCALFCVQKMQEGIR